METKQTAVDWLKEQFIWMIEDGVDWFDAFHSVMAKFEQAKQMEKEQIKDAFVKCWESNIPDGIECKLDAEEYYNKTYGPQVDKK